MLPPGSTIGILGGGQLGRMLAIAAAQLGYRTRILAPDAESVAAQTASSFTRADYHSRIVLDELAASADVVTYEFENIAIEPTASISPRKLPVHPAPAALEVAQDRATEKSFVDGLGGRTAPWRKVDDARRRWKQALAEIGAPAILKTLRLGYDGKGQVRLRTCRRCGEPPGPRSASGPRSSRASSPSATNSRSSWRAAPTARWSAIRRRGTSMSTASSTVPRCPLPPKSPDTGPRRRRWPGAWRIRWVMSACWRCEFFATEEGPVFNEMAPRVHNSGHWTIEGAVTSQFENHIRAICGLPLGDTGLTAPRVEMENLIGEDADRWAEILAEPGAHLHLYGKTVRPGRKMGHVTGLGVRPFGTIQKSPPPSREAGLFILTTLRDQLTRVPVNGKLPNAPAPTEPVNVSPSAVAVQSSVIGIGTVMFIVQWMVSPSTVPLISVEPIAPLFVPVKVPPSVFTVSVIF